MSSFSSTALTTTTTNNNPSNTQNNDPYLTNDFHPLSLASSEILVALRSDESNVNSDLYRRLISSGTGGVSNGSVGAHQYYVVDGADHGCGHVDTTNNNNNGNDGNDTPRQTSDSLGSTHGNIIGSPLGVLRNANRQSQRSSSKNTNTNTSSPSNNSSSTLTNKSFSNKPPTSYLKHTKSIPLPTQLSSIKSTDPKAQRVRPITRRVTRRARHITYNTHKTKTERTHQDRQHV